MRRGACATISFLLTLTVATQAIAQSAPAPSGSANTAPSAKADDVVVLKTGATYRGTISEKVPDGNVVIVTVSGDVKTFAMSDVKYAGPYASMPPADAPAPLPAPPPGPGAPPPPPTYVSPSPYSNAPTTPNGGSG